MALLIAGSPRSALDGQLTASRVALKAADQSLAVVVYFDQCAVAVAQVSSNVIGGDGCSFPLPRDGRPLAHFS